MWVWRKRRGGEGGGEGGDREMERGGGGGEGESRVGDMERAGWEARQGCYLSSLLFQTVCQEETEMLMLPLNTKKEASVWPSHQRSLFRRVQVKRLMLTLRRSNDNSVILDLYNSDKLDCVEKGGKPLLGGDDWSKRSERSLGWSWSLYQWFYESCGECVLRGSCHVTSVCVCVCVELG